eukprot:5380752-Amphidinium_carterae.1
MQLLLAMQVVPGQLGQHRARIVTVPAASVLPMVLPVPAPPSTSAASAGQPAAAWRVWRLLQLRRDHPRLKVIMYIYHGWRSDQWIDHLQDYYLPTVSLDTPRAVQDVKEEATITI